MLRVGRHNSNRRRILAAFTLIEMMVVLGIIGLVAAMTIPMMIPFVRARKMSLASETVKSACLLARSKAIKERRRISVTLLEAERLIIINDYDQIKRMLPILEMDDSDDNSASSQPEMELLRTTSNLNRNDHYVTLITGPGVTQQRRVITTSGNTLTVDRAWDPALNTDTGDTWIYPTDENGAGVDPPADEYVIGDNKNDKDRCPHYVLDNYADEAERERILTTMAIEKVRTLPEGARFDLDGDEDGKDPSDSPTFEADAWTYVFLPTGGVWTLPPDATNLRETWSLTTHMDATNRPSGPRIYAPEDRDVVRLVVYAMTGQARTEEQY